jgi:inorganic pyrophosphatase
MIEGKQGRPGKWVRNDRLIAIENDNHSYASIRHFREMGKAFCEELFEFFVNYHCLSDVQFKIVGRKGPAAARRRLRDCRQ